MLLYHIVLDFNAIMQYIRSLITFLALLSIVSCHTNRREQFSPISKNIPAYVIEPNEQLEYALRHYWDDVNFKDTTWLHRAEEFEQRFVGYFALLSDRQELSVDLTLFPLTKLDGDLLMQALMFYRRYYYEAESPLQDDEVFRYVTIWAMSSPKVPAQHQEAARELFKGLNRNRVGQQATDFVYKTDSTSRSLFPIERKYQILLFGTPDCYSCRAVQSYIAKEKIYKELVEQKRLNILTVYIQHGGERTHLKADTLLPTWIHRAYDAQDSIIKHRLYDIKSSPTIYLIGQDGTILLRDPKPEKLTKYLERNE